MALVIHLKDKTIEFADIIDLEPGQLARIQAKSATKTEAQWLKPGTESVKIPMTHTQKETILEYKNQMVKGYTGEGLIKGDIIRFSNHAKERVAQRIDKDIFPDPDTLIGMADLLIQSKELQDSAAWRGYGGLSYSFNGEYDGKACTVAVVFDGHMVVVTIITDGATPMTYSLGGSLNPDALEKLQKARAAALARVNNRTNWK